MKASRLQKLVAEIKYNLSLFLYIIIALIPVVCITVIVTRMTTSIMTRNSQTLVTYQADRAAELLSSGMDSLLDICYSAITDQELKTLCIRFSRGEGTAYTTALLNDELNSYMGLNPNISQCLFISADCQYTTVQRYRPKNDRTEWESEDYRQKVLEQVSESSSVTLLSANQLASSLEAAPVFYIGIPIYNSVIKKTYGVLMFGIRKSFFTLAFFESGKNGHTASLPEIFKSAQMFLTDSMQKVIYASDPDSIGNSYQSRIEQNRLTEDHYILSEYDIENTDWHLFVYCPKKVAFQSVKRAMKLIYALIIIFFIFIVYAAALIISHQNRKIQIIAEGIQKFKGDEQSYEIPLFSNEHLNAIITQFNLMTKRLLELTDNLKKEQEKNLQEVELRRKAELKTLEMQINPHFLYNTLDTINWMAIMHQEMEISEMLGNLGSLLRYSVTNIDAPVLIRAELEWIRKYLYLQKKRFHTLFTYDIQVEPGVENLLLYKMLLQPVIENSIIHGFSEISEGGHIFIEMRTVPVSCKNARYLQIIIEDNGSGIRPKKMEQLTKLVRNYKDYDGENIGIFNILNRLYAYYGNEFYFSIESHAGTKTTLRIPADPRER